ncbi:MAG TPA: hypothetical protein VJJ98_05855 [Sedimentisphaerales bacterium]|nr:hypothetical protein [Sedimentisphaerales bacterium]
MKEVKQRINLFRANEITRANAVSLIAGVIFTVAGSASARNDELGITLDATYVSRYIWRGMDTYPNNHSAIQPSIDIDFYGTGFGLNTWWSRANGSGFENSEEIDYTLYYWNSLFEDEPYATECTIGWVYYSYPDEPKRVANTQEVYASLSWPNIWPGGLVPCYTIVSTWPSESGSDVSDYSGWVHILGLCYDLTVPGFLPGTKEQILHFSTEAVYNDGAYGAEIDHDWSHAVFGISTSFDLGGNLAFTPGFYYQSSWDDSVNTSDEYWTSLSLTYTF